MTGAPSSNVNVTQRYDMSADTWETGPEFTAAKADFALAASGEALYAIAGDNNGAGFFDATASVHRLDVGTWPSGSWEDLGDPLPSPRTANQAGFCTTAKAGGEIYSVGGFANFIWNNETLYRESPAKAAPAAVDVPWVSEDPALGTIDAGASVDVTVTVDASVARGRPTRRLPRRTGHRRGHAAQRATGPGDDERQPSGGLGQGDRHDHRARRVRRCRRRRSTGRPVQIGDFTVETDDDRPLRVVARRRHLPDHGQRRRLRHPDR